MFRCKPSFWASGATLLTLTGAAYAQDNGANFSIKDGDRVVFYGDSITDQRLYTTFVEDYIVTRFPRRNVSFVHSGWGGDRVTGGGGGPIDLRLQRDVLAYKPSVMTIMLGMNDGSYRAFDQGIFDTYSKGYQHIIDVVKKAQPDTRFTVIVPSPYDDATQEPKFEGGYNAVLMRYGEFVKELAKKENLAVADLNTPVVAALQKAKQSDATLSQKIIPDRVHPGPAGHLLMAEALLKAWNAPATVSAVEIDAAGKRVARADNTQVAELKTGDVVSWTQTDGALPLPAAWSDPIVALAVKSSDVLEALNQQPLKVTGLKTGKYTLKIDGSDVGNFSAEQWAQGINLAILATPMAQQAQKVHDLTQQHNNQHFTRWRTIQVPLQNHSAAVQQALPPLLAALDSEEAEIVAQQRAAAQPVPHRYEISIALPDPAGANLALRKTYVSSDPNVFNWGIGGLTDGSWEANSEHSFASGDTNAFPKTATIDLGETKSVGDVLLGVPPFGSTKTIKVSLSADGQNFSEVGTYVFSQNKEEKHRYSFAPANARYVRLSYPDHYDDAVGYTPTFVFTNEVEVYAPVK